MAVRIGKTNVFIVVLFRTREANCAANGAQLPPITPNYTQLHPHNDPNYTRPMTTTTLNFAAARAAAAAAARAAAAAVAAACAPLCLHSRLGV